MVAFQLPRWKFCCGQQQQEFFFAMGTSLAMSSLFCLPLNLMCAILRNWHFKQVNHMLGSETGLWVSIAWGRLWPLPSDPTLSFFCVGLFHFCPLFFSFWLKPPFSYRLDLSFSLVVAMGCICQERSKEHPLYIGNRALIHFCCVYTAA